MLAVPLRLSIGLVLFAGVSLVTLPCSAQSVAAASVPSAPSPPGAPPVPADIPNHQLVGVTIIGEAAPVQPQHDNGSFQKVALRPGQQVQVLLTFPAAAAGMAPQVLAMDGGTVSSPLPAVAVAADGRLPLTFQAGQQPGLYRLALHGIGADYVLRFWVVDPARPLPTNSKMLKAFRG